MKKNMLCKEKLKIVSISMLTLGILCTGTVFAEESSDDLQVRLSDDYLEWSKLSSEEKENSIMPSTYGTEANDEILSKYEVKNKTILVSSLLGRARLSTDENVSATSTQSRYSLVDDIDMRVEYQGTTSECWAFSLLKSMETNEALMSQTRTLKNYSERHMDYATSRTFLDGINSNGFNREVGKGGLPICGLAYLTNGQGAVLESDMPFEDNEDKINLSEINKNVDTIVSDYVLLPTVTKSYVTTAEGNTSSVKYYKSSGEEYTQEELQAVRQMIKEHIIKYGGITTMTAGNQTQFYNNSDTFSSTNYNCNVTTKTRDHAITIVGWDDNYSRDNFAEGAKPSSDGAYIVLNSYGEESFDNGYLYISYEDYFIEDELYGICSTSSVDYDTLYQHDYYGGIYQVGSNTQDTGYFATVFEKSNTAEEYLSSVGISLIDYAMVEIYVNPNGTSLNIEDLELVAAPTTTYAPGYHTIDFDEIKVSGTEFAIVVKQTSESGSFYFSVETSVEGTAYSDVTSSNLSYYSLNGVDFKLLNNVKIAGVNLENSDVCIKAFTTNESKSKTDNTSDSADNNKSDSTINNTENTTTDNTTNNTEESKTNNTTNNTEESKTDNTTNDTEETFKSDVYQINEEDIMKIEGETTIESFLKNINTNLETVFYDEDTVITSNSQTIKTGMKLKLSNNKEYTLIVRGDINCDGRLGIVDISKLILHYNEAKGFELTGNPKKGADMNADGVINLVDISQMIKVYNSK